MDQFNSSSAPWANYQPTQGQPPPQHWPGNQGHQQPAAAPEGMAYSQHNPYVGLREPAPQFGGPGSYFSPLGGMYMSPTSAALPHHRSNEHAPISGPEFVLKDWYINPKTPKTFEEFKGKADQYNNWSSRVKDHLMSGNLSWGRLLEVVEQQKQPLTKARLAACPGIDDAALDLVKISQLLWAFLGSHALHNNVYERRVQLTGGEDGNGLELWRSLFQEFEGGAEQVIMAGITRFRKFPNCPHRSKLQAHL